MMVWMDVETTGLDENKNFPLEVAGIITQDNLETVSEVSFLVRSWSFETLYENANPFVREMHETSGLWAELKNPHNEAISRSSIDDALASWMARFGATAEDMKDRAPLCGSSVSFDRRWVQKWLPKTNAALHYQNIDISTVKELYKRFCPNPKERDAGEAAHRALPDVRASVTELKFYLDELGWPYGGGMQCLK